MIRDRSGLIDAGDNPILTSPHERRIVKNADLTIGRTGMLLKPIARQVDATEGRGAVANEGCPRA